MSSNDTSPVDLQRTVLTISLDSTLMYVFMMGIYTAVFVCTLYLYGRKKKERSIPVIIALLVLFATSIANIALQWKVLNVCFIDNGQSMLSAFVCNFNVTDEQVGITLPSAIISDLQAVIADGLLVWRCYHLAGKSLRGIMFPLLFFVLEIAIGVVALTTEGMSLLGNKTAKMARVSLIFSAVFFVITALTTLTSTIFIIWRIRSSTREIRHTRRYQRIIRIAIESSVVYAIASILNVLSEIVDLASTNGLATYGFASFVSPTTFFMIVISPTLMIAQLSLSPTPGSTTIDRTLPISTLQFHHQVTENGSTRSVTRSTVATPNESGNSAKEQA